MSGGVVEFKEERPYMTKNLATLEGVKNTTARFFGGPRASRSGCFRLPSPLRGAQGRPRDLGRGG